MLNCIKQDVVFEHPFCSMGICVKQCSGCVLLTLLKHFMLILNWPLQLFHFLSKYWLIIIKKLTLWLPTYPLYGSLERLITCNQFALVANPITVLHGSLAPGHTYVAHVVIYDPSRPNCQKLVHFVFSASVHAISFGSMLPSLGT
jgi:hypothetical protein